MTIDKSKLGLVHAFYGNGRGKTTAALGTALRACGNGYKVHLVQFMKNGANSLNKQVPGEISILNKLDNFSFKRFGTKDWVKGKPNKEEINSCKEAFSYLKKILKDSEYELIIADEILYAVQMNLLTQKEIIELIKSKNKNKELILTGSHKPFKEIFKVCNYITEVKKVKHPYDVGILAREGIEY